jgi:hypothetical protein
MGRKQKMNRNELNSKRGPCQVFVPTSRTRLCRATLGKARE